MNKKIIENINKLFEFKTPTKEDIINLFNNSQFLIYDEFKHNYIRQDIKNRIKEYNENFIDDENEVLIEDDEVINNMIDELIENLYNDDDYYINKIDELIEYYEEDLKKINN